MRVFVTGASGLDRIGGRPRTARRWAPGRRPRPVRRLGRDGRALGAEVHRGRSTTSTPSAPARPRPTASSTSATTTTSPRWARRRSSTGRDRDARRGAEGSGGPLVIASGVLGLTAGGVATEHDGAEPASTRGSPTRRRRCRSPTGACGRRRAVRADRPRPGRPRLRGRAGRARAPHRRRRLHRRRRQPLARRAPTRRRAPRPARGRGGTRRLGAARHRRGGHPDPRDRRRDRALARRPDRIAPAEHFGRLGPFFGVDAAVSNTLTRELLGWDPTHPGLLEDLDAGTLRRRRAALHGRVNVRLER